MQTTKTTNYIIASLRRGDYQKQSTKSKLPKIPTIELLLEGEVNYQIPNANYQNYQLIPGGGEELPKTIEHMPEMKFAYFFHKSCINCKNWSCTSSC